MNAAPDPNQLTEWTVRYLDGDLDGDELAQLNRAIADDPDARTLFDDLSQHAFALADTADLALTSTPAPPEPTARAPFHIHPLAALAVAAALVLGFLFFFDPTDRLPVATLTTGDSPATVLLDGTGELVRHLPPGESIGLHRGHGVRLTTHDAGATLSFPGGSTCTLTGTAEARVGTTRAGGPRLTLSGGQSAFDIAKQKPGKPFTITTPTSTIEVLGTRLEVNASDAASHVAVSTGRVALVRHADGARIEIPAGQQAESTLSFDTPLKAEAVPARPDTWEASFTGGLPAGWRCGKWLPDHAAMLAHPNPANGFEDFSIASSNAWAAGHHSHFQVHPDSVLQLTYTMEQPGEFEVMLNTRTTPDTDQPGGNAFYDLAARGNPTLPPGEFQTVSVPLADFAAFRRAGRPVDATTLDGLAVFGLYLSTGHHDRGLAIKNIRITREP